MHDYWLATDYRVTSWLVNSMESNIASNVMFLTLAKKIRDTLRETYGHEKNISRVFEKYEFLFSTVGRSDSLGVLHFSSCSYG